MDTATYRCDNCQRTVAKRLAACPACGAPRTAAPAETVTVGSTGRTASVLPPVPAPAPGESGSVGLRSVRRVEGPFTLRRNVDDSPSPMALVLMSFPIGFVLSLVWGYLLVQTAGSGVFFLVYVLAVLTLLAPTGMLVVGIIALGVRLGMRESS